MSQELPQVVIHIRVVKVPNFVAVLCQFPSRCVVAISLALLDLSLLPLAVKVCLEPPPLGSLIFLSPASRLLRGALLQLAFRALPGLLALTCLLVYPPLGVQVENALALGQLPAPFLLLPPVCSLPAMFGLC